MKEMDYSSDLNSNVSEVIMCVLEFCGIFFSHDDMRKNDN